MRKKGKDFFSVYLGRNGMGLWITLFFLLLGISIGAFSEKMMGISQKSELVNFVNSYFNVMHLDSMPKSQIFIKSIINNFQLLGIIFLSGVTVIGFPVAIGAITFRGITIGFATAFFMEEMKIKGLMLAIFSILPQNLVFIPAFVVAAAVSMGFAFSMLRKNNPAHRNNYLQMLPSYISLFLMIAVFILVGCVIESFICPVLIKMILSI